MTKQEFIYKLETEGVFPETEQQVKWFEEWYENNPKLKSETEEAIKRINENEAAKFMYLKVLGRIFCENNSPAMCSCKIEPRKITIFGFNNDKFEIEL